MPGSLESHSIKGGWATDVLLPRTIDFDEKDPEKEVFPGFWLPINLDSAFFEYEGGAREGVSLGHALDALLMA